MSTDTPSDNIEIGLLLDAIHAKYGYDFRGYAQESIRRRVRNALAKSGLPHLGELQHRVLHDPLFFSNVLEDLTVNVTDMFRNPQFYATFRARIVPALRKFPALKIWHCGCSTGEEVYSSAIVLAEEGLYERAQIFATDVSSRALEGAKQGIYVAERLGTFESNYATAGGTSKLSDHFAVAFNRIVVREHLRKNIHFFQHNVVTDHVFGEMHLIFCRNVLIYFDEHLRRHALHKFSVSLCADGFLCLGQGEQLRLADDEALVNALDGDARIYRRATKEHP